MQRLATRKVRTKVDEEAARLKGGLRTTRAQRVLRSSVTLLILYFNVATLGTEVCRRMELPYRVPLALPIGALFNVFPVFTHYLQYNSEVVAEGLPESASTSEDHEWIALDVDEYLPYGRGDLYSRVIGMLGHPMTPPEREQWLGVVMRKVRERHNLIRSDTRVRAVRLRAVTWPRSKQGYRTLRNRESEALRIVYSEAP